MQFGWSREQPTRTQCQHPHTVTPPAQQCRQPASRSRQSDRRRGEQQGKGEQAETTDGDTTDSHTKKKGVAGSASLSGEGQPNRVYFSSITRSQRQSSVMSSRHCGARLRDSGGTPVQRRVGDGQSGKEDFYQLVFCITRCQRLQSSCVIMCAATRAPPRGGRGGEADHQSGA
jgi:hypothetical protein